MGVLHCTHSNGVCHAGVLSPNLYDIHQCCVYGEKLPMMDRGTGCVYGEKLPMMDRGTVRNMQIFIPKNKFEKLVYLVGFIIRKNSHLHASFYSSINIPHIQCQFHSSTLESQVSTQTCIKMKHCTLLEHYTKLLSQCSNT